MSKRSYKCCSNCTKVIAIGTTCECGILATIKNRGSSGYIQCLEYFSENLDAQITGPAQKKRVMKSKGMEEVG